ncbi:MAG: hypothetical protein EXR70_22265 [Deltaproteobacteria bacterium]|nr:hypothetical protein [Deltaproteobacteria bacterium]
MESKMTRSLLRLLSSAACSLLVNVASPAGGQESTPPEIALRKSVNTRLFQGKAVEGEDRQIGPGDSLWRILVEGKGSRENNLVPTL